MAHPLRARVSASRVERRCRLDHFGLAGNCLRHHVVECAHPLIRTNIMRSDDPSRERVKREIGQLRDCDLWKVRLMLWALGAMAAASRPMAFATRHIHNSLRRQLWQWVLYHPDTHPRLLGLLGLSRTSVTLELRGPDDSLKQRLRLMCARTNRSAQLISGVSDGTPRITIIFGDRLESASHAK